MAEVLQIVFNISILYSSGLLASSNLPNIHYYIDPGTGSLILQVAIGSIVGALFLLKVFWRRITTFIKGPFSRNKKDNQ